MSKRQYGANNPQGQSRNPSAQGQGPHKEIATRIKSLNRMSELDVEEMVRMADKLGKHLTSRDVDLKTSQIRRFSDAVKRIESQIRSNAHPFDKNSLLLLKPRLAYATGRLKEGRKNPLEPFQEVMDPAIDKVQDVDDFLRFAQFMESIIAYHRFHGGKDN